MDRVREGTPTTTRWRQKMCGRYVLRAPADDLVRMFLRPKERAAVPPALLSRIRPRFNTAPTQDVLVVKAAPTGDRVLALCRWGLLPPWAKDPRMGARLINARIETVGEKPSFRSAQRKARCLVLADGFIEWRRDGKRRVPFLFEMHDRRPFAFAGLTAHNQKALGAPVETCTILTCAASALLGDIHHRMPVIVPPSEYDAWLDPDEEVPALLNAALAFPAKKMRRTPIRSRVNDPRHDDAACLDPADDPVD